MMGKRKVFDDADEGKKLKKKKDKKNKKSKIRDQSEAFSTDDRDNNHDDITSCLHRKRIRLVISLLPAALSDIERAVHISIRQLLLKYSDSLGGVLLAYENLHLEKETLSTEAICGIILNELPHIHFRVTTTMLIFSPVPGKKV